MLDLVGVSKSYAGKPVLGPIDLSVSRGTTVLIGPSGCGKSTLLRLMIGLVRPDAGTVSFEKIPLDYASLAEIRRRMGYVIQDGGLFPHLTARENVLLVPRFLRWPRSRMDERVNQLTQLVSLTPDSLERVPDRLSGGQRQRVGLMRALMLDPDVLLLDEPLAALDPMVRHDLQEDLRRIVRSLGKTVVLVTHDMGEAAFFGDTIVLLRAGAIVQRGSARNLLDSPADEFVTRFINAQRRPLVAGEFQ